jgi:hypothetical protein
MTGIALVHDSVISDRVALVGGCREYLYGSHGLGQLDQGESVGRISGSRKLESLFFQRPPSATSLLDDILLCSIATGSLLFGHRRGS